MTQSVKKKKKKNRKVLVNSNQKLGEEESHKLPKWKTSKGISQFKPKSGRKRVTQIFKMENVKRY